MAVWQFVACTMECIPITVQCSVTCYLKYVINVTGVSEPGVRSVLVHELGHSRN